MSDPIRSDMDALPISQASERTPAETMQLRNRERLRQPETYGSSLEAAQVQRIEQAKRQRSGKKRSVTLRITQINRVLTERGSRTKVKYLRDKLQEAYNKILEVNEGLMQLLDPEDEVYGNDYVEEIGVQVDECCSEVESYLVERKDDPPSTSPSSCSDLQSDAGSSNSSKTGAYGLEKTPHLPPSMKQEEVVRWMERENAADQIADYTQERLDAMMHKYDTKFINRYDEAAEIVSQPSALICTQRPSVPASESIPLASLSHVPEFIPRASLQRVSDFAPRITGSEFAPRIS